VEVRPLHWLSVRAAYGEGYRSPQARTLEDGERAPFSKVRSADLGAAASWPFLELSAAGFYTHLSDDVAFEAREGRLERIGETQRLGAVFYARTTPLRWLVGALSVTYVHATLRDPPPPTAEEPQPAFLEGEHLPFVPPVVLRLDLGAHRPLVEKLGRYALAGRAGAGLSYLSPRPLPYGEFADAVGLLDLSLGLSWGPLSLDCELYNLLDSRYAAVEYNFASHWNPEAPRTRVPARHIAAGSPRSWLLTLGVQL
jgi:outer membrane receptor protein involved in Fe transport